jgi:hypothetical protein
VPHFFLASFFVLTANHFFSLGGCDSCAAVILNDMLDKMKFYLEIYNATEVRWPNLELFFPEQLVLFQGFWCLSGGAGGGEE